MSDPGAPAPDERRAPAPAGPANLEHRHLRSALEFVVGAAVAAQRLKPTVAVPADLKPFFKQQRLPGGALGKVRRIVEADPAFRRGLAEAATPELVDEIGLEWLRREDGWEDRVAELVDEATLAVAEEDAALALKRSERRREAAEQLATRSRVELAALRDRLVDLEAQLGSRATDRSGVDAATRALRTQLSEAKLAARHARDREDSTRARLEAAESDRDAALARAVEAERQRDALLSARAEAAGVSVPAVRLQELREIAEAARAISDQLKALVDTGPVRREPVGIPGSVARDQRRAAEFVLKVPGILVLIDGYNVAKLAWPDSELECQREQLLDAVDAVARRYGVEIAVIFDGAAVTGSHARRRRLARVRYSPPGVIADDVIRAEVAGLDPARPVAVVTNDIAVRRDVASAGANIIASDTFVALALG